MSISKRNTIIAGAAAAAVFILVVVLVVVVVAILPSKKQPDPQPILKRCAEPSNPIADIRISSCPNSAEVGYCEIINNHNTKINVTFMPGKCR